jgi:hypothetical protein
MGMLAAAAVVSGCLVIADVELEDMTGDWEASQARFAEPGNLNNTFDLIENGWVVLMTVADNGGFSLTLLPPVGPPDLRIGTLTVENGKDVILTRPAGPVGEGEVFLEDEQMALIFDEFAGIEADINGNGVPIPVTLLLVMERP